MRKKELHLPIHLFITWCIFPRSQDIIGSRLRLARECRVKFTRIYQERDARAVEELLKSSGTTPEGCSFASADEGGEQRGEEVGPQG